MNMNNMKIENKMTKIEAKIVKHSVNPFGDELITYELIFPRFLLAELNTHRMFSKNSASSRAIPFKKMVEMVQNDPFIPIAWQKEHKGMQGNEYITTPEEVENCIKNWKTVLRDVIYNTWRFRDNATINSEGGIVLGSIVTKQLCNRLLEPFMWHKVLLTTGKGGLQNFFELRCPCYEIGMGPAGDHNFKSKKHLLKSLSDSVKSPDDRASVYLAKYNGFTELDWLKFNKGQAEIHMMELAESMYDAYNESVPQKLESGQWHIPYEDIISHNDIATYCAENNVDDTPFNEIRIKASTGLCARTSYLTVGDDKNPSIETLIGIHDKMKNSVPKHSSPMEHCSVVPTEKEYLEATRGDIQQDGWFYNYRGFKSYRYILDNNGTI